MERIPGEREPLTLTFVPPDIRMARDEPTTMDAATIAERQREGGGAPSQRRPAAERLWWSGPRRILQQFLTTTRATATKRFRANHA